MRPLLDHRAVPGPDREPGAVPSCGEVRHFVNSPEASAWQGNNGLHGLDLNEKARGAGNGAGLGRLGNLNRRDEWWADGTIMAINQKPQGPGRRFNV